MAQVNETQPETPDKSGNAEEQQGVSFSLILWIVVLILLAYPLSIGPVIIMFGKTRVPKAVDLFYSPLEFLYNHSTAAKAFFDWYLHLWGIK